MAWFEEVATAGARGGTSWPPGFVPPSSSGSGGGWAPTLENVPPGFDAKKWVDPNHTSPKYVVGRIAAQGIAEGTPVSEWLAKAAAAVGGKVQGDDSIVMPDGAVFDAAFNASGEGGTTAPIWEMTSGPGGAPLDGSTTGTENTPPAAPGTSPGSAAGAGAGSGDGASPPGSGSGSWFDEQGIDATGGAGGFGSLLQPWSVGFDFPHFQPTTGADLLADPGYQFRMEQSQKALERSAAAKGTLFTGGTGKALQALRQELGSQEFGAADQRRFRDWSTAYDKNLGEYRMGHDIFKGNQTDAYNRLAGIAGFGQTSGNPLGGQTAGLMAQNYQKYFPGQQQGGGSSWWQNPGFWGQIGGVAGSFFSSETLKDRIIPLDETEIAEALRTLPLYRWHYTGEAVEHLGPMAEEFQRRFRVGDGKTIHVADVIGVLLAAEKARLNA